MKDRKHIRLTGFDYSSSRNYFFTIIVKGHIHAFGEIADKTMKLSINGKIAIEQWPWLGNQYPYIDLISFVVMPDHVHGIIHINPNYYIDNNESGYVDDLGKGRDPSLHKINQINQINNPGENEPIRKISKIKPLPELIGAYKTTVSKRIHLAGDSDFKWQNSFHDHIIRNTRSLNWIKHYIETNPENWMHDHQ